MLVVRRTAIKWVLVGVVRVGTPGGDAVVICLVQAGARVVRIGLVGEGRSQENDWCERACALRQYIERQPVLAELTGEMQRVGATREIVRHSPRKIRLPTAIAQVVVVEMNGTIVVLSMAPALLTPAPPRADHGARRQVHQFAVAGMRADVEYRLAVDPQRKIPTGEQFRY